MKDYQYYLELIIAGTGGLVWIFILSIDVFGAELFYFEYSNLQNMSDALLLGLLLILFPFVFVSGIIIDRISDFIFDKLINIKISKKYFDTKYDYQKAKSLIFYKSSNLKALYEYGRMRSRVCRSWTINSILILLSVNYLVWGGGTIESTDLKWRISIFVSTLLLGSTFVSFFTWRNLTKKEYRFVKMEEEILNEICD